MTCPMQSHYLDTPNALRPAGIGLFFCAMSVMEGNSMQEAWASTKEKFKPTMMANYMLWPVANLVNFAFVPPAQRILYCNVVYVSSPVGVAVLVLLLLLRCATCTVEAVVLQDGVQLPAAAAEHALLVDVLDAAAVHALLA